MVVVPAGSFTMGSPANEKERWHNEGPQHSVRIGQAFAVGRFAVTFDEWDACVADGGCEGYRPDDRGWGRGRRPVIYVSWEDAKTYLQWLSRKTGHEYRLLSEAEREYVTRAGTTTPFWWGASITTDQANYNGNYTYNGGAEGEWRRKTLPVGSFEANPLGLFDVHGNVFEWVEDCLGGGYKGAPTDGSAWTTTTQCFSGWREFRGGSWVFPPRFLRAAARHGNIDAPIFHTSGYRVIDVGFRVGRTLIP